MSTAPLKLRALLGDYASTLPLKRGEVGSPQVDLDFADVKVPNTAFRRTVRDLEFDVSELAIVTHLIAKAHDKPLVLLPAVVLARFQHNCIIYDPARGRPDDLAGRRIGVRSYTTTTAAWARDLLRQDYALDSSDVQWVTFEDSPVAEYRDPPNVERVPAGANLIEMLLAGEIDVAVLGMPTADPRVQTLYADTDAAARDWYQRHGVVQINHMVAVKASLSQVNPEAVRAVFRLLVASKQAAGLPRAGAIDDAPLGIDAVRPGLEVAIDCAWRQRLIPRRYTVDELFDDVTGTLNP